MARTWFLQGMSTLSSFGFLAVLVLVLAGAVLLLRHGLGPHPSPAAAHPCTTEAPPG